MKKENNIPEYKINCGLAKFDGYTNKEIQCSLELYKIVEMMNSKKFTKRHVELTKKYFSLLKECERINIPVYTQSENDLSRIENMLSDDEKVEYVNILMRTVRNRLECLFYASTETRAKVLYEFLNALTHKKS